GIRAEREDLAVARIDRHERAGLGAVDGGGLHAALDRVVGRPLEVEIEGGLQPLALARLDAAHLAPVVARAERVDDDPREAVLAAQVLVVALLEAVGADARARRDAPVALLL